MRTRFAAAALDDPDVAASDAIIRACVHCGFCTASCPTYVLDGNELDSPRGRIVLIQEMLEKGGAPDPQAVTHIDRCLSCLACMTACPSGVHYGHLVDHARAHIEAHHVRPFAERAWRAALDFVLPRKNLFAPALGLGRIAKPFAKLFPERIQSALRLVPPRASGVAPKLGTRHPAIGPRKFRAALMPGCVQGALSPAIDQATIRVLTKRGVEVVVPEGVGCCGALSHHLGKRGSALCYARSAIRGLSREIAGEGLDFVVANAAGCGTMIKDYGFLFRAEGALKDAASAVASRARDVTEVLDEVGVGDVRAPRRLKVAYQSACSLQHGQKLSSLPRRLLSAAGFEVAEPEESHLCCGSAGSYSLLEPTIGQELRTRKIERLERLRPDVVASGNIGCITHLGAALTRPICHTIELIDWAAGGPEPSALARRMGEEAQP
jgi:glycolate oxidase iron-sulfur subunit